MEYYRNLMSILRGNFVGHHNRPTLDELHGNQTSVSFDNANVCEKFVVIVYITLIVDDLGEKF